MLLRRVWRRAGLWALAAVLALAVGVPLISQGWLALRQARVHWAEIAGEPPAISARVPLVITQDWGCTDACDSVLRGRGLSGAHVLRLGALAGADPGAALALADLPLEHWAYPAPTAEKPQHRTLTAEERREAAARIDYVVLVGPPFSLVWQFPADDGARGALGQLLSANPALAGAAGQGFVHLAMAPMAADGTLEPAALQFDVLDLWFDGRALGLPLAPGNWQRAANSRAAAAATVRALCPNVDGAPDWFCAGQLQ